MTKKAMSPLAKDLIEALGEVYDDVTGRTRLFRYPRRVRITGDLSGVLTINDPDNFTVRLEREKAAFVRCVIR
jgi:hypothetical protein